MIDLKNVSFDYDRRHEVFLDLSLTFRLGHIYGLLGCNGVGKTTMLHLMCGLLRPDFGQIRVNGFEAGGRSAELFSELVFFPDELRLPDIPLARFAEVTGRFYPNFSTSDFEQYCAQLGVDAQSRPAHMSLGDRKKSYLAFALACNARYLLMDEPTNGLDIPSKAVFRRLLAAYASEDRVVVLATHQVREVEELIDHVVICDKKGVALDASMQTLSECLYFGAVAEDAGALYRETTLLGDVGVAPNTMGEESRPRLELLFNAVASNREGVARIVNAKTQSHE